MAGETVTGRESLPSPAGRLRRNLRWMLVGLLLAGAIIDYFDRSNLSIAAPFVQHRFHLDPAQEGLLLSAFSWVYAFANLPAGWLVDRFGPRRILAGAATLWSLVSMATPFMPVYSLFLVMRGALGAAEAPFFSSGLKATRAWFPPRERGTATSVFNMGSQLASVIGPPILTVLMLALGWQSMFVIVGAAGLVVAVLWFIGYRAPREHPLVTEEELRHVEQGQQEQAEVDAGGPGLPWGALLLQRSTWGMILGDFGFIYAAWVFVTWLPTYLETSRGLSILHTGFVAAIPFLAASVGVIVAGIVSDYLIERGVRPIASRRLVIVVMGVLVPFAVVPAVFVGSAAASIALISIGLFLANGPSGVIWTLASDVAPERNVASLGAIQNFGGYLGGALAPLVTGIALQATGSFVLAFVLSGAFAVFGAICYLVILRGPIRAAPPASSTPSSGEPRPQNA